MNHNPAVATKVLLVNDSPKGRWNRVVIETIVNAMFNSTFLNIGRGETGTWLFLLSFLPGSCLQNNKINKYKKFRKELHRNTNLRNGEREREGGGGQ